MKIIYLIPLHVQVFEFVKLKELYYAGSHGMDILVSSTDTQSKANDVSTLSFHCGFQGRFKFLNFLYIFSFGSLTLFYFFLNYALL